MQLFQRNLDQSPKYCFNDGFCISTWTRMGPCLLLLPVLTLNKGHRPSESIWLLWPNQMKSEDQLVSTSLIGSYTMKFKLKVFVCAGQATNTQSYSSSYWFAHNLLHILFDSEFPEFYRLFLPARGANLIWLLYLVCECYITSIHKNL